MVLGFVKAAAETDETGSMIGRDGCQSPVGGLPVLRVWDENFKVYGVRKE